MQRIYGAGHELVWADDMPAGGWRGPLPLWPFDRPEPAELGTFINDARLVVEIIYSQAHPMVPPSVRPLDPEPALFARTIHAWHLNGDGTLCFFQAAGDWEPSGTAADLIVKAAGWFLEYELMRRGAISSMTERGLSADTSHDGLFIPYVRRGA